MPCIDHPFHDRGFGSRRAIEVEGNSAQDTESGFAEENCGRTIHWRVTLGDPERSQRIKIDRDTTRTGDRHLFGAGFSPIRDGGHRELVERPGICESSHLARAARARYPEY